MAMQQLPQQRADFVVGLGSGMFHRHPKSEIMTNLFWGLLTINLAMPFDSIKQTPVRWGQSVVLFNIAAHLWGEGCTPMLCLTAKLHEEAMLAP